MSETTTLALQRDSRALEPTNFSEAFQAARLLHASGMFPTSCKSPEAAFIILTKGRELGLPMVQAATEICVVKGKVQLSAALMQGLILQSGASEYFACRESTATLAVYETQRRGDPTGPKRMSYGIEDAQRAGLVRPGESGTGVWVTHPADMLRARAASKLARMVYPDVLAGCYTPDEIQDFDRRPPPAPAAPREPAVALAEVVETPPPALPPVAEPQPDPVVVREPVEPRRGLLEVMRADLETCATSAQVKAVYKRAEAAIDASDKPAHVKAGLLQRAGRMAGEREDAIMLGKVAEVGRQRTQPGGERGDD